jgi:uncharacterized protein (DUF1919 family)
MAAVSLPTPRAAPKPRVWEPLKVWRRQLAARIMRQRVTARDFTIISNDCWGGMAYEELGRRYDTPFVGLFLMLEDYMRLLPKLRFGCESKIEFVAPSRHEEINRWRETIKKPYPIGVLGGDVEIQFLHYANVDEAKAKWNRRAARIHWNRLLVKTCWHDDLRMEGWLREFEELPFQHKLSLVPREIPGLKHSVVLRDYTTDGSAQYWNAHRNFDVAAWLNDGTIRRASWARPLDALLYWHY